MFRPAVLLALLALCGRSSADPEARVDVTGTYDGTLTTGLPSRFSAAVRLVAREAASGSVTGTFILDSASNATAYTVTGQHVGQRL